MIDLLCCFFKKNPPIHRNKELHSDLQWWHLFLVEWHGVSFWLFPEIIPTADIQVSSDASGSLGFGAYWESMWFTGSWHFSQQEQSIAYMEFLPVVIAAHVWGHHRWCRKYVPLWLDNDSGVHILNARTSTVPFLMHWLCTLLMLAACHSFHSLPSIYQESLI